MAPRPPSPPQARTQDPDPHDPAVLRAVGTRTLRETLRRAPAAVVLLTACTAAQVGSALLVPRAVGDAVDAAVAGSGPGREVAWLAALLLTGTAATGGRDLVAAFFGSTVTERLRGRMTRRLLALGPAGARRFPAGDVLARLTDSAANPASFLPMVLAAVATVLTTLGAVAMLALVDWRLAATFVAGVPLGALLLRAFVGRASAPMADYHRLQAEVVTRLLDAHRGARSIRAGGTLERDVARVLRPVPALHETGTRIWAAQGSAGAQLALLAPMLQVAVLAVGGIGVSSGSITAGELLAAVGYTTLGLAAIGLFDTVTVLLTCQVGAGRVGQVLEAEPAVGAPAHPRPLPPGRGRLELRDVVVRHGEVTVLDHVGLVVPEGVCVALVGRSGAGKSVLARLAGRLADPDEGRVLLDGAPVEEVDPAVLRRAVAYAFDRPALLGTTVADMLTYGGPPVDRARVQAAAAAAKADEFIRLLPEGYDTPLELAPMSGGERQRLGIARAALRDARLLVLDDATSSVDTATEREVAGALAELRSGRTCVVVAHRAGTAARADLVAWLEDGRLRALAPHAELWRDPAYRRIFAVDAALPAEPGAVADALVAL